MLKIEMDQELVQEEKRLSQKLLDSIGKEIESIVPEAEDGILAASFISDDKMKKLNQEYRGKDSTTDVLSFSYLEDAQKNDTLGDIVISYQQAERQAEEKDIKEEIVTLLTHGILHIFGYDHEAKEDAEKMFSLQDKIVSAVLSL